MHKLGVLFVVLLSCLYFQGLFAQSTGKDLTGERRVTVGMFLELPFGYEPSVNSFQSNLGRRVKLQKYSVTNRLDPSLTDTVYRFYYRKSELFLYRTQKGRDLFFAGNIYHSRFPLSNGIQVGMKKEDFFDVFSDLDYTAGDSTRLSTRRAEHNYTFYFKKGKLTKIKIDNYID